MVIIDDSALQPFRAGFCEVCGKRGPTDPHHVLKRGLGGGGRCDHAYFLVAACRLCHTKIECGQCTWRGRRMVRTDLFGIIALREGVRHYDLEVATEWFRNASPKLTASEIANRLSRMRPGVARLVKELLRARERSQAA